MTMACGIGWRQAHEAALLEERPALDFVEVHAENFFGVGGAARAALLEARRHWPVSLHGVGLALGSAVGLDAWHLDRLAELVDCVDPVFVSDHASFARVASPTGAAPVHGADLLPVAFTPASLDLMVAHVQQVQERLRRPILVENLAVVLRWADEPMSEPEFFNALTRRSGCGVLLDVNNLVVNALNRAEPDPVASACAWVDALSPDTVGEIHLAGYDDSGPLVIDDHGSRVHPPVWQVFRHAVHRLGRRPTLIEWDTDLPPLAVLLDEARRASAILDQPRWVANASAQIVDAGVAP